jgi:hypothetical protein
VTSADWRKSSRSGGDRVLVRDSLDRSGPVLAFGRDSWKSLMRGLKSGCAWRGGAG